MWWININIKINENTTTHPFVYTLSIAYKPKKHKVILFSCVKNKPQPNTYVLCIPSPPEALSQRLPPKCLIKRDWYYRLLLQRTKPSFLRRPREIKRLFKDGSPDTTIAFLKAQPFDLAKPAGCPTIRLELPRRW